MTLRLSRLQRSSGNSRLKHPISEGINPSLIFFVEIVFEYVDYLHFTYVGEDIAIIIKEYIAKREHCLKLHKKYSLGILTIILVTDTLYL